jgi:hypothetical protein
MQIQDGICVYITVIRDVKWLVIYQHFKQSTVTALHRKNMPGYLIIFLKILFHIETKNTLQRYEKKCEYAKKKDQFLCICIFFTNFAAI